MSNPQSLQGRLRNIAAMDLRTGVFLAYTMDTAAEAASALDARDAEIARMGIAIDAYQTLQAERDALLAEAKRTLEYTRTNVNAAVTFVEHDIGLGEARGLRQTRERIESTLAKLKAAMKTEEGKT